MYKLENDPTYRFVSSVRDLIPSMYVKQLADTMSEYSALSVEELKIEYRPNSAQDCIAILLSYWIVLPPDGDYYRAHILDILDKIAYSKNYQGKWIVLKEIKDLPSDESFCAWTILEDVIFQQYSKDDVFGNILPLVRKHTKRLVGQRKVPLLVRKYPKVNYPQRKRGYSDHGSAVVPHKRGRRITTSGANPERVERNSVYPSSKPTNYMWTVHKEIDKSGFDVKGDEE